MVTSPPHTPPARKSAAKPLLITGITTLLVLAAIVLLVFRLNPLGQLGDRLFGTEETVSAGGTTLMQIQQTAQLKAATGTFAVPIFLEKEQKSFLGRKLPGSVTGERVVALYQGTVDATIDLQGLTENDIIIDQENNKLTIKMPAPVLSKPNIDEEKSQVVAHTRGVLPRLEDALGDAPLATRERLDDEAVAALTKAANESDLVSIAQKNGQSFLTSLGHSMGYKNVHVIPATDSR